MIDRNEAYAAAISAPTRQIVPRAIINLIDPDVVYEGVTGSPESVYSRPEQLYDLDFEASQACATMELNRWLLNGEQPLHTGEDGEQGFISEALAGDDGAMSLYVELSVSNLATLQAMSVYFPLPELNGVPEDFTLTVYSGSAAVYTKAVTGNRESTLSFDGFTVKDVTALRLDVSKWSTPFRRLRCLEILPGIYENWDGKTVYSLDVVQQADFSCLTIPYGTAKLAIRNEAKRFDPRSKNSLFQSIEARQAVQLELGVVTEAGTEYMPLGTYYQQEGGWSIDSNGLTLTWSLADIVGLLANRKYEAPPSLPTTLVGWLASIVGQLGENFTDRYTVDETLGATTLSCTAADLANVTCGSLLRWVCQAAGAYPMADPVTGYLTARTLNDTVTRRLTLRELSSFPTITANDDLASITFKIGDNQTTIAGTNTAASKTVSVSNPFITTTAQAATAARNILVNYGGNKITARGRGDMANELGDVNAVEIIANEDMSGRRIKQQFTLSGGVMKNVAANFVQATGLLLYENHDIFTSGGTWTAPSGVTQITFVLIGGGDGGGSGTDGTWEVDGEPGAGGLGGKVLSQTVTINAGQSMAVTIGAGGAAGQAGGATTLGGAYSSANGARMNGFAILALAAVYAQNGEDGSGVIAAANTGNGGGGGTAGLKGVTGSDGYRSYIGRYPTKGGAGAAGGSGIAVIFYDKG